MVRLRIDWGDAADLDAEPIRFPATPCCNCGATDQLEIVERRVLSLPFCPRCRASAHRTPTHWFTRIASWAILFLSLMLVVGPRFGVAALAIGAAIPVIAAWAYARPRGAQTSYYQPVRFHWISGLVFTNDAYAMRMIEANPGRVQIHGALAAATVRGNTGGRLRAWAKAAAGPAAWILLFLVALVAISVLEYFRVR